MKIRVLIVEDDVDFCKEIESIISHLNSKIEILTAQCQQSGEDQLGTGIFDLIILDLNIPTLDSSLDSSPDHGYHFFLRAKKTAPGTPILVLTGSTVEPFVDDLLDNSQKIDVWGNGAINRTVIFLKKYNFDQFPEIAKRIISALESLQSIEINQNNIKLTEAEERLVRIFTIRCGGVMSSVTSLGGGLSGVRVIKLLVTDRYGAKIHNAVAKLGTPEDIRDEAYRVQMYVSRLNESSTPRQLDKIEFGAGKNAGVFYSLADPYESTAYASALKGGEMATLTVRGIASAISNWNRQIPQRPVSVTEIRQRTLSDEKFFELVEKYELQWILPIEQATVQVCWGCTHGDLHGFNALVAEDGRSVVIDYGDVAEGPVSFDPVTLELSLLFHPGMNETVNSEWPSLTQAEKWGNVELFLDGCPVPDFIRECRDWALDIGAGQREISASAYSYLMRQLKYPDTDKERILALLKGVKNNYDNTM